MISECSNSSCVVSVVCSSPSDDCVYQLAPTPTYFMANHFCASVLCPMHCVLLALQWKAKSQLQFCVSKVETLILKSYHNATRTHSHNRKFAPIFNAFNARAGDYSRRYIFGYNSPAAIARELFKPSTDVASLLDSIKKKFLIWVRGSPGRSS